MRTLIRRLSATMYCGRCKKTVVIADGLRCSECGL
jgi:DNA-directed RNA polymerase subunit RPC12/RpoP